MAILRDLLRTPLLAVMAFGIVATTADDGLAEEVPAPLPPFLTPLHEQTPTGSNAPWNIANFGRVTFQLERGGDGRAGGGLYFRTESGVLIGAQGRLKGAVGGLQALIGLRLKF